MEEQGKGPAQIAKELKIGDNTLYTWIHGDTMPQKRHRQRIAQYFGLPAAALFSDDSENAAPIETAWVFKLFKTTVPKDRPAAIIRQACKELGIIELGENIIKQMHETGDAPEGVKLYLAGEITELELYNRCLNLPQTTVLNIKHLI
ncbi:MAG: helix-turn-helix domain-containing protein [Bacteroidales bacterium]|nr:helix-turn-helix domain-containing protein [Bacteroidales bacterium]